MSNKPKIMINCHNLNGGGGLQVADSICKQLNNFQQYHFVVVMSSHLDETYEAINQYTNISLYKYEKIQNKFKTLISGRDEFLDKLVERHQVQVVLTIFGPSFWKPRIPHICGFARGHILFFDSPFYQNRKKINLLLDKIKYKLLLFLFDKNSDCLFTENPSVTQKLEKLLPAKQIYTVTNYYHQVFDQPENWIEKYLPYFEGITLLTVTAMYPHKNLPIMVEVAHYLKNKYPHFKFRFVITINKEQFPTSLDGVEDCFMFIGRVNVRECPSLYQQADIMFMPTLMECFTATYPEAMRMEVPIITTDLDFAHGLCAEAACYYSALDSHAAAESIYKVSTNSKYANILRENGKKQLAKYDTYIERTKKLVSICENILSCQ